MKLFSMATRLVLSALALILFALLPFIGGSVADQFLFDNALQSQMDPINLQIEQRTDLQKIGILRNFVAAPADMQYANIPQDVLKETVLRELSPYLEAGLIDRAIDPENCVWDAGYWLYYMTGTDISNTYWTVTMSVSSESFWRLNITLDDETGKLLYIHFDADEYQGEYTSTLGKDLLISFQSIYLNNLNLPITAESERNIMPVKMKDGSYASELNLTDDVVGEFALCFEVTGVGFFSYFV